MRRVTAADRQAVMHPPDAMASRRMAVHYGIAAMELSPALLSEPVVLLQDVAQPIVG